MKYVSRQRRTRKFTKKFMTAIIISIMCLTSIPVFAGNLKFIHGNNVDTKRAFGRTESTTKESSMKNQLTVSFSDGSSYGREGNSTNSSICYVESSDLKGRSGSSYCVYIVNGRVAHRSTKAYPFNF